MATVTLPTQDIADWDSFHSVCSRAFGFPDFYGRNMNAWIDCLSYLHDDDGMCSVKLQPGDETLFVHVREFDSLLGRAPEVAQGLVECTESVNRRYEEAGDKTRIELVLA